jgi:GNAT superfamily N-acetyltransferase
VTAVSTVGEADLGELLPLMRAYADFYAVSPTDDALLALSRALIADPVNEGMQFLARDDAGRAIGFATVYWLWSTTSATRIGLMNDLFVAPEGRGSGAAEALIERCRAACRERGASKLYDRIGGHREEWLDYWLEA